MDFNSILSSLIGKELTETLIKSDGIFKPNVAAVASIDEMHRGLSIVPKIVLKWLSLHLKNMQQSEVKDIQIPWNSKASLHVEKKENDLYSGHLLLNNKPIYYTFRTLPGVGLILLSHLELYDLDSKEEIQVPDFSKEISDQIDEKLKLIQLVENVVEKKLTQREAIEQLVKDKIQKILSSKEENVEIKEESRPLDLAPQTVPDSKIRPLKAFLDSKREKNKVKFSLPIQFEKNENLECPDCLKNIFLKGEYKGCICFGDDEKNEAFLKKNNKNTELYVDMSWDKENIEMLMDIIKKFNN
jgi:hypothetical protein